MRTRIAAVAALLAVAIQPVPAAAMEQLDRVEHGEASWVAYRLFVPARGDWGITITGGPDQAQVWGAGIWRRKAGEGWKHGVVAMAGGAEPRVSVSAGGDGYSFGDGRTSHDNLPILFKVFGDPGGEYVVVAAVGGRHKGAFVLEGSAGVAVLDSTRGNATTAFADEDFGGTGANATATDPVFGARRLHAGVMLGGAVEIEARQRLFGLMWLPQGFGGASGPPGADFDGSVFHDQPPGAYRFAVDAGVSDRPVLVWTADVALPT